jgi:large conductance mechanosensitive channel
MNAVLDFLIKASVVYFLIVLPLQFLLSKVASHKEAAAPTTKTCPECLSEIPLAAKRCRFCGEPVPAVG